MRPIDILHRGCPEIVEHDWQPIDHIVPHGSRHHDLPGLRCLMDPRSDVDAVPLQKSVLVDDILDVDSYAQPQGEWIVFALRDALATLGALDVGGPADGVHDAGEFRKHGISGNLSNASTVPGNVWFDDFGPQRFPTVQGFHLIERHQTGKARDVGKGDGGEPTIYNGRCDGRGL